MRVNAAALVAAAAIPLPALAAGEPAELERRAKYEACRAKLMDAQKDQVVDRVSWAGAHRQPFVILGPAFHELSLEARRELAAAVNCYIASGKPLCVNFKMFHWQSGKPVARYKDCRFIRARNAT